MYVLKFKFTLKCLQNLSALKSAKRLWNTPKHSFVALLLCSQKVCFESPRDISKTVHYGKQMHLVRRSSHIPELSTALFSVWLAKWTVTSLVQFGLVKPCSAWLAVWTRPYIRWKQIMDLITDLAHQWTLSNGLSNSYSVSKCTE
jgi:hypothetical protein